MKSEITNITKAINRLSYTTANQNKCNSTDAEALNFIIDFVNNANEKAFNENQLYSKLYADALRENFNFFNCIEIANEKINKTLNKTLSELIYNLQEDLNAIYFENYLEKKGIKDVFLGKFGFDKSYYKEDLKKFFEANKTEILKIRDDNKEIYKNIPREELIKSFEIYDYNEVYDLFKTNATLSFNKFKNLK